VYSYLVLESTAEYLNAAEIHGTLESLLEAPVLASLPADLTQAAAAAGDDQQRHQSDDDRRPHRN